VGPRESNYTQGFSRAKEIKLHTGLSWAKRIKLHTGVEWDQGNYVTHMG
jgi:hypothetical protein